MKIILRLVLLSCVVNAGLLRPVLAEDAIFAGGCFWCVESDFESVPGVLDAQSGYIGGSAAQADYKAVSKGGTGHYEAVLIRFDPAKISYGALLYKFWRSVDPLDAGGQFCDRGDSYRTAVFTTSTAQAETARKSKAAAESALGQRIVTPIVPAKAFYPAEAFHQDYYKSTQKTLTRFGLVKRKDAYKKYRVACGRDARIKALWGGQAHALPAS
ncbi:peptide-methionine (S)-S-oxide reductase MsrA [Roseobacter sp. N2S]|uniref:peptide-methionine (S)-S-oxide reductase MsrA n=1 Tax=Roseobacter sp. N2S TaxID=2663844 RepID=UPI00285DA387|nr:peptide-methionine (S)-S-oxide reductase MsrA [Roseobacter sp. N2S]MDR6263430.1 peptide-methionine (S)-S-oxide reductase [Roseobacter sp. N2S]